MYNLFRKQTPQKLNKVTALLAPILLIWFNFNPSMDR